MRRKYLLVGFLFILLGLIYVSCNPKVTVETPKPLEINVNVRIDIYNHVAAVEQDIYGDVAKPEDNKEKPSGGESLIRGLFMQTANGASEDDEYNSALQRRKARKDQIIQYKNDGSLGENHRGLVSLIDSDKVESNKGGYTEKVKKVIKDENSDRETMYVIDAAKRGVSADVLREETARFHRDNSKKGWWIEVQVGGKWVWKQK